MYTFHRSAIECVHWLFTFNTTYTLMLILKVLVFIRIYIFSVVVIPAGSELSLSTLNTLACGNERAIFDVGNFKELTSHLLDLYNYVRHHAITKYAIHIITLSSAMYV